MLRKILRHKATFVISLLACLTVAGFSAYLLLRPEKKVLSGVPVKIMTIQESVTADGKIDSDKHVSLSFKKAGTVNSVKVQVGDKVTAGEVLVTMDAGQLQASLAGAKADVLSAEANLASLKKGATSQTRAVYIQNVSTTKLALSTAVRDSYLKVQDALLSKLASVFKNNSSPNPILNIPTDSFTKANTISLMRADMTNKMSSWNSYINIDPTSDQTLTETSKDVAAAKSLINLLSDATNRLTTGNSGMTQTDINTAVASVTAAASEVNAAEIAFNSALQAYRTNNDQLSVIEASSTPEATKIAEANLAKAQANVSSIQSQINDTVLVAPWDGIVASVNPKVGENFNANISAVDVISPGTFKTDIMIPENEVALISVGDQANIHFGAYGASLDATGTVSSIDLSPTTVNGVSAYKATVYLNSSDPRIRTGMTGSVTILGSSVDNAVAVPTSSLITKNDGTYILVLNDNFSYSERKVIVGANGGDWSQIVSGVNPGEIVATFGSK